MNLEHSHLWGSQEEGSSGQTCSEGVVADVGRLFPGLWGLGG